MNDFIMINEKNPPMENGYRNGVSKNGQANGSPKVESVNGANAKGAIQLERPLAVVNPRPAAAVKEQRAQLRGIGVVGLGYWGPNWVRNLHQSQAARTNRRLRSRSEAADCTSANCTRTSKPPVTSKTC